MTFKRKQFLGLGLTVFFMLLLMSVILYMSGIMKANMIEFVKDRYYKVNQASEIRRIFDVTDRQLLRILIINEEVQPEYITQSLKGNEEQIQLSFLELEKTVTTDKGRQLLRQVENSYASYNKMEREFLSKLSTSDKEELRPLYDAERPNRDQLLIYLEEFIKHQESLMDESLQRARDTHANLVILLIAAVCIALLLIVSVTLWLIRDTSRSIYSITNGLKKIDYGKDLLDLPRLDVKTEDEFGNIAKAFNSMAASIETYVEKETEYMAEISEQNWIQSHSADIVHLYSQHVEIDGLAKDFIYKLAYVTKASLGVFYLKEQFEGRTIFKKTASYANETGEAGRDIFELGEGLVGQCAKDKKIFILNDVPEEYHVISTGLGHIKPKSILMAPVLMKDDVSAVIELASLEPFTPVQTKLLEEVLDTLGIAVTNILGRMEIAHLLEESQAKTEELQMQSEELQTQSEELQSQSEELQTQAEELRMINEQLEERTNDAELKSEELKAAKEALEEKAKELIQSSKYKTEFLANMSHELRTPLNSILLLSEMLSDDPNHGLSEEQIEFTKMIHSSGQDLLNLINDILDLSKVEVGKLEIIFEKVVISEFASLIDRNFIPIAKQKELNFTVTADENTPEVIFTDEQRLKQMIKNLLSNAFKFTEKGSVSLRFNRAGEEDLAQLPQAGISDAWLKVVVSDTGIGIPPDKYEEIFQAFQQVDGATMRKYGGTGLGLSITKEFAALLGGVCKVESKEGLGSSFTLLIPSLPEGVPEKAKEKLNNEAASAVELDLRPLKEESASGDKGDEQEQKNPFSVLYNKKVLVVDDDHRNIYATKNALEKEGMKVLTAENGMGCLEVMGKDEEIDIVLMDIMMPVMDGYETMERIRATEQYKEIPIIALTAKAMNYDRKKCLVSGASDYISKPLKLDQLLSVMRVWLS